MIDALITGIFCAALVTVFYLAAATLWQVWQARRRPTRAAETQDDFTAALARGRDRMERMDQ